MLLRPFAERPVKFAVCFPNGKIIDAGEAMGHKTFRTELPVLIAIGAKPDSAVVMPFISKTDGDAVFMECPKFLDQSILQFAIPLPRQKSNNGIATCDEFRPVTPNALERVGRGNFLGTATIPAILSKPNFLRGRFQGKGRQRWSRIHNGSSVLGIRTVRLSPWFFRFPQAHELFGDSPH